MVIATLGELSLAEFVVERLQMKRSSKGDVLHYCCNPALQYFLAVLNSVLASVNKVM
jgi:hypothetical protein